MKLSPGAVGCATVFRGARAAIFFYVCADLCTWFGTCAEEGSCNKEAADQRKQCNTPCQHCCYFLVHLQQSMAPSRAC